MAVKKQAAAAAPEDLSDLKGLVLAGKSVEDNQRADVGGNNSFISIVPNDRSPILKAGKPEYIEGAVSGGFVITSRGMALGTELDVTVLGIFKFYEETEILPPGDKGIPKFFGRWMESDAIQVPLVGQFDRPFIAKKDGKPHQLKVVHWVSVVVKGHEDLKDVLFSFRSKGNQVSTDLAKVIKKNSQIAPQLRFKVTVQEFEHELYNNSTNYPKFDLIGENFLVDEDGTPELLAKGGMKAAQVRDVITRYNELQTEYEQNKMIALKGDITKLIGPPAGETSKVTANAGKPGYKKPADEEDPQF